MIKKINLFLLALLLVGFQLNTQAEVIHLEDTGTFIIRNVVTLPVSPEQAYDIMTGDISGWWDHSMSADPKVLMIEAKPGGHFIELFDDSGDGVIHATVIYAHRGKMLRFDGPLGLSGRALDFVTTWTYEATENGCLVKLEAHCDGEINAEFAQVVDSVWNHFFHEQLKPYVQEGKYKK
ncbi:SRPBCC domain-containing protein [bacterium]|nr:SRPBCC domain-containing protein [bacterium]